MRDKARSHVSTRARGGYAATNSLWFTVGRDMLCIVGDELGSRSAADRFGFDLQRLDQLQAETRTAFRRVQAAHDSHGRHF